MFYLNILNLAPIRLKIRNTPKNSQFWVPCGVWGFDNYTVSSIFLLDFTHFYYTRTTLEVLYKILAKNICGYFNIKGFEFRLFNTHILIWCVKINFWAKNDIMVQISLKRKKSSFQLRSAILINFSWACRPWGGEAFGPRGTPRTASRKSSKTLRCSSLAPRCGWCRWTPGLGTWNGPSFSSC